MSASKYRWDDFSDQPYPIDDPAYKKSIRRRALPAFIKMLLANLLVMPFVSLLYFLTRKYLLPVKTKGMIGLCVNADKEPELTPGFVKELGVKKLSIRLPLHDVENIDNYYEFARQFSEYDILFVILQDRRHIEDKNLLRESLTTIFRQFQALGSKFQIGNAINRTKWGFVSLDEYFEFYQEAYQVRESQFPDLELMGSAVIDFEVYAIARSVFHLAKFKFDGMAALLYVDRRGAPENRQFNFDLPGKIALIRNIVNVSPKVANRLLVTETNWPIEFTRPYAPALDDVWVNEEDYANFMLRYFLLAMASGRVETIYWHQLVAPGYGLIDNREGAIVKRKAFDCFATLQGFFGDVEIRSVEQKVEKYTVKAKRGDKDIWALWSTTGEYSMLLPAGMRAFNALGSEMEGDKIPVSAEIVYFLQS